MARLAIRLLGSFQATVDGEPVTGFETAKARALLAYLAVESDRPHRREYLAEMLWPERPIGAALANLRHTLARLRQAIGDPPGTRKANCQSVPPFLLVDRQAIQFNCASDAWVDVLAFTALLHTPTGIAQPQLAALEEAAELYRGAFLDDLLVRDCKVFEQWMVLTREQTSRLALDALRRLAEGCEQGGDYERALQHAQRWVEMEPWDERAQRQVMRLLVFTGQRNAALAQYEACFHLLVEELGVQPEAETTELSQRIRDGLPAGPASLHQLPAFMHEGAREVEPPVFVARERELARLHNFLDQALGGQGRVAFVTGGPGQGKTALLGEFARRALNARPDLLAAAGCCGAISGIGDPYLPFRHVMSMLTGDLEGRWGTGFVGRNHARRLWSALPVVIPALLERGSSLIGTIVSGEALLGRVASALTGQTAWTDRIRALAARTGTGRGDLDQKFLFEQYADVLSAVASRRPLLLVLDDIQWADSTSIGLLFHLVRRLADAASPILIVCAYRPEEVASRRGGERHPLEEVLREFKRTFGDVWVDLDGVDEFENRRFVNALLDTERNRLSDQFRDTLFRRTGGHPLFTVELLRVLRERGEIVPDVHADGAWVEGPALDWDRLPTRVEAVIESRVNRLNPELREILSVASVEGEQFTAQVVAAVQDVPERSLLQALQKLEKLYRLVGEIGDVPAGEPRRTRYQFSHILVQEYLYRQLSLGEQRLLHGQVATVLAQLYRDQQEEVAARLAQHFDKAGIDDQAFHYARLAAENATRAHAHREAISVYTLAIGLAPKIPVDTATLIDLYHDRGRINEIAGDFQQARADFETALKLSQTAGQRRSEWRALLDLAELWTSRDYDRSLDLIEMAQELAQRMDDPAVLAGSLNWVGNWHSNAENPAAALGYHQKAFEIFERLEAGDEMARTLDQLGLAALLSGDLTASVGYYDRAIALFRKHQDRAGLTASLTGRGLAVGTSGVNLTTLAPTVPADARRDLDEALQCAREIDSPSAEAWALWALSLVSRGRGQFGEALERIQDALDIAYRIGHGEWMAGTRSILGELYTELLAPEEALPHLEQALALSQRLGSQHWYHHAAGALAATWRRLGDPAQALAHLTPVISGAGIMDTLHKRRCWARRAELALDQADPALALDIVNRLIDSTPGRSPGRVTPFLWLLKGDTLVAMGREEDARPLLEAALDQARVPEERFLLWPIHGSLGRLYDSMQRRPEAEQHFVAARQLIEELAQSIPTQALRTNFLQRARSLLSDAA